VSDLLYHPGIVERLQFSASENKANTLTMSYVFAKLWLDL